MRPHVHLVPAVALAALAAVVGASCGDNLHPARDAGPADAGRLDAASCVAGQPCTTNPGAPCTTGKTSCATGAAVCVDATPAIPGTMCATGVCDGAGACAPCVVGDACIPTGGTACEHGTLVCASGTPTCTNVTTQLPGSSCGTDQVCGPNGACVACAVDAACSTNPNACVSGLLACGTGVPTCLDSATSIGAGMSCGTDKVCSPTDVCIACTADAPCPGNPTPCRIGLEACGTGVPTCADTALNQAPGFGCGTDKVCSSAGDCVACTAAAACSPGGNTCLTGTTDCSTGGPVCTTTGAVADLTACSGGGCFQGACEPALALATSVDLSTTAITPGRTCAEAISYAVTSLPTTASVVLATTPAAGCLAAGDAVLLINLQGAPGATTNTGNYEVLQVASVTGATVTLIQPKVLAYGNAAGSDANIGTGAGQQRVMLQRVPQLATLAIAPGATVTAGAFDGQKGGVLALRVAQLTINGTVSMSGKGFRGGVVGVSNAAEAQDGWILGVDHGGTAASGYNGGNGGGASGGGAGASGVNGAGGAGGAGGGGAGDGWFSPSQIPSAGGGGGGGAYTHGRLNLSPGAVGRALLGPGGTTGGGGGGGGGYFGGPTAATGGAGGASNGSGGKAGVTWALSAAQDGLPGTAAGAGGGIILLSATTLTVGASGAVVADGGNGGDGGKGGQGGGGVDGSGGGGSGGQGAVGGAIIATATTRTAPSGFAKARGGTGGAGGTGNHFALGLGGAGGAGGAFVTGGEAGGSGGSGVTGSDLCNGTPCLLVNGGGGAGGRAGTTGSVLLLP